MARSDKLSMYATSIRQDGDDTVVRYHTTDIVRFNRERIVFDFGGWDSVTTRRKMNQTIRQFGLGRFGVGRVKGDTFVDQIPYTGVPITIMRDYTQLALCA